MCLEGWVVKATLLALDGLTVKLLVVAEVTVAWVVSDAVIV